MLVDFQTATEMIATGRPFFLAADETVLARLPRGNWIAGTIPYFMDATGGVVSKDRVFVNEAPACATETRVAWYAEEDLPGITRDAPQNGFSVLIVPAMSYAHVSYARHAPGYHDIFLKPIIGWVAGVHLADLGKVTPKVWNGRTGDPSDQDAVAMHVSLPAGKLASIGIVNLFSQGDGDAITFEQEGFSVRDCLVGGEKTNFAEYIASHDVDIRSPLVADYCGTAVNVSFQAVNQKESTVSLYAPVFKGVEYRIAAPVADYVKEFSARVPSGSVNPVFSCNCILNFLYSELEGKKTGSIVGPITFGEIAYQLLNQTLVYLEIKD